MALSRIRLKGLTTSWLNFVQVSRFHAPRNVLKLSDRGLIKDFFPHENGAKFAAYLEASPRCIYAGFDPTADSLHIGNLLVLISLLHCQRAGHKVIALIGGATARIGDPSGKSEERPMLASKEINKNVAGIKQNIEAVFRNHAELYGSQCKHDLKSSYQIVDNLEWYGDLSLLDFLSSSGRYFRVGKMLSRKSVKDRLESDEGISLTEFCYQAFQAMDWRYLLDKYDCTIQVGGSDQYGNIHAGHEFISRVAKKDVYGITLPIVTSESGEKMGKSAGVPVWLSSEKTNCFHFYQFFIRLSDADAANLVKMFTFLPDSELKDLIGKHERQPEKRFLQQKLAEQVTMLVHGPDGLNLARKTTKILYENDIEAMGQLQVQELTDVFSQSDYVRLLYEAGIGVLELAMKIGCFHNEKDAIRIITAGGFYINQVRCTNTEEILVPGMHILPNNTSLVRVGKKNYYVVEWTI